MSFPGFCEAANQQDGSAAPSNAFNAHRGWRQMDRNSIQSRREQYFKLSSQLAQIDNARLRSLFDDGPSSPGWGVPGCGDC
jgi:hypothetical protein